MASVKEKIIKLDDSQFGVHDAEVMGLYYCKEKNIYILEYVDLSSKGEFCFTVLRRVNGNLMRDSFTDYMKLVNESNFMLCDDFDILPKKIRCLKVPKNIPTNQEVEQFAVFCNDNNEYFIRRGFAERMGVAKGKKIKIHDGIELVCVSHDEINEICNNTAGDSKRLEPIYYTMEKKQKVANFKVLTNGDNLYIARGLANRYGIEARFAIRYDSISWVKVSSQDIQKIIDDAELESIFLTPLYESLTKKKNRKNEKATDSKKSTNRKFTVVIDVLSNDSDIYLRKDVAERFNLSGEIISYDSISWVKVTGLNLDDIQSHYKNRNVSVEFNTIQMKKTDSLSSSEFEVLVDGDKKYIPLSIAKKFDVVNLGEFNIGGKDYCRVTGNSINIIKVCSWYDQNPLTPKYKELTKTNDNGKHIELNYCIVNDMKYIPANTPYITEEDRMYGKSIRVNGIMYLSIADNRLEEIINKLREHGYEVSINHKNIEKINGEKIYKRTSK